MSEFSSHKSTLDDSDFSNIIKSASGLIPQDSISKTTSNITELVKSQEIGTDSFSNTTKCRLTNNCIPNCVVQTYKNNTIIDYSMFSPDGNVFLVASKWGDVTLFNSRNGSYRLYQEFESSADFITQITISPDNTCIACVQEDSELFLYYMNDPSSQAQEEKVVLGPSNLGYLYSVRYSSNGKELLLSGKNDMFIFDRTIHCPSLSSHFKSFIQSAVFSDDSSQIIYSGGTDGLIKIWDRRALSAVYPRPVSVLTGHIDEITHVDSKGDGRYLISKSKDLTIKLWDIRGSSRRTRRFSEGEGYKQKLLPTFVGSIPNLNELKESDMSLMTYSNSILSDQLIEPPVRFSPLKTTGQRYIYTGSLDGDVIVYDALTGKIVNLIDRIPGESSADVSWHPTRNEILRTSFDGMLDKLIYCNIDDSDFISEIS